MKPSDDQKKPYQRPQLVEYGDLSALIKANQTGVGMPDGGGGTGKGKGQFKTG